MAPGPPALTLRVELVPLRLQPPQVVRLLLHLELQLLDLLLEHPGQALARLLLPHGAESCC